MDGRALFHEFTWAASFEEARRNATGIGVLLHLVDGHLGDRANVRCRGEAAPSSVCSGGIHDQAKPM
jgi:hypothetical protein